MSDCAVKVTDLRFRWKRKDPWLLHIPLLEIKQGECVFVHGASGSGKTTLLNLLGGVVVPEQGSVEVLGTDLCNLSGPQRDSFRADHIGFIFQMFNLVPFLSAVDNVCLPCRFSQRRKEEAQKKTKTLQTEAARLLRHMRLEDTALIEKAANRLSVGQQQRVAVARSLIGAPKLIIADEPTSALDAETRVSFLELLFHEVKESGASLLFVSHDRSLAPLFDRNIALAEINRICEAVS